MEALNIAMDTTRLRASSLPSSRKSEAERPSPRNEAADGLWTSNEAVPASLWNAVEVAAAYMNFM